MQKYIVLDRDGVINYDSDEYIKSPQEFIPIPGSLAAIARLNKAGYKVIVATNQSGIARGYFNLATLEDIHKKLIDLLAQAGGEIEEIFYCPHGPDDNCDCRKPQPGMLKDIIAKYLIHPDNLPVIGDSLRDLQMAQVMGAKAILVKTGKGESTAIKIASLPEFANVPVYADLAAAVDALISP